ncbi:Astacin (Peptidase M12A) [Parelaphostrongylus tenuis]|uniref:Astacin (Peptidase M12A) n=1 Tax=Parelaphostrongylus tenuis TaxID=148309 RepID=A0AAD5R7K5_PARTN|nr:Astacin (Peptidase M12A) [Parelaphostrongylus tenuis]
MKVILLASLATLIKSEKSFEEKLEEGNELLKNEPDAENTMQLLKKLHSMEDEILKESSKKQDADELKAIEDYAKIKKSDMTVSVAGINEENGVGNALFQGDIVLTKLQADEMLADVEESLGHRSKRQAYRDEKYPKTLWSDGINYVFWNATNSARRVFKKAAVIWSENTCIDFKEDYRDKCTEGSSANCENGGFPHPRDCSKCICPSGYGGTLCNERPPGCGKILTATKEYQELSAVVGQKDYNRNGDNDDFFFCHYWIEGPPGSTIEVIFQNITANLAYDGCVWAGVEIKTLADQRHTGYR